jgi:phosphoadenosine phosphosulfate reductase
MERSLASRQPPAPRYRILQVLDSDSPVNGNGNGRPATLPMIGGELVDPAELAAEVEPLDAHEAIAWALERFHPDLRFAVSFQKTSSVIVDLAHSIEPSARFFYVDTGLLFPETHATREALAERYGIEFERFADVPLGEQGGERAVSLWRRDPNACCADRKVELMHAALDEVECWVSGIRRVDSPTRAEAAKLDWDERFGLWKLNPLADWDDTQVWNYIKDRQVPYNELHDQGYPSIGCMPCTAQAPDGGDSRAGRWAGTDRTECGIHG